MSETKPVKHLSIGMRVVWVDPASRPPEGRWFLNALIAEHGQGVMIVSTVSITAIGTRHTVTRNGKLLQDGFWISQLPKHEQARTGYPVRIPTEYLRLASA